MKALSLRERVSTPLASLRRWLPEKRWSFVTVVDSDHLLALGTVDLGYTATVFASAWNLRESRCLVDFSLLIPRTKRFFTTGDLIRGTEAELAQVRFPGKVQRWALTQSARGYRFELEAPGIKGELNLEGRLDRSVLAVTGKVPGATRFIETRKQVGLSVSGRLRFGSRVWGIDPSSAVGGLDFTQGELPYRTQWFWGFAPGVPGFNLAQGNNLGGANENGLWQEAGLKRLPPVVFHQGDSQESSRKIISEDGAVKLQFRERGRHSELLNLGLISSRFHQLYGYYDGEIGGARIERVPGIWEDQAVRW